VGTSEEEAVDSLDPLKRWSGFGIVALERGHQSPDDLSAEVRVV